VSEHSEPQEGLDSVLDRLEKQITRLADGSAPLDELVEAHEEAQKLIDTAQGRLRELMARLEDQAGRGGSSPREANE
jgi:exodeoxyribonuclease VII small subunit